MAKSEQQWLTSSPRHLLSDDYADTATGIMRSWGWGTGRDFAELAAPNTTTGDVISQPAAYSAVLVLTSSGGAPTRRAAAQPFFDLLEPSAAQDGPLTLSRLLPVSAINTGAGLLEAALGRRLFPLRVTVAPFQHKAGAFLGPFAVYDMSTGVVTLDTRVVETLQQLPEAAVGSLAQFASSLLSQVADGAAHHEQPGKDAPSTVPDIWALVAKAAGAAATAALVGQTPLWFCLACPIVLGMLAPFLFNFGLGALADLACTRFSLPRDECNDLWYGVFALAMVLSFASAIPIVYICKLPQCGKRGIAAA